MLLLQLQPVHPFPFTEPLSQPLSLFSPFTSSPILNHISVSYLVGCAIRGRTLRPRRSYGEWLDEKYSLRPCQLTNIDKLQRPLHTEPHL
jgi:hypothetical protein